jgi:hypothetical protein
MVIIHLPSAGPACAQIDLDHILKTKDRMDAFMLASDQRILLSLSNVLGALRDDGRLFAAQETGLPVK